MTDAETARWGSLDNAATILHAIENSQLIDWEPEQFGSVSRREKFLAKMIAAIAPQSLLYVNGKVELSGEPYQIRAHAFAGDAVVVAEGNATDPTVTIYPNKPERIQMRDAVADFRPRGHVAFEVAYSWGSVIVSARDREAWGNEAELLSDLRSRLA